MSAFVQQCSGVRSSVRLPLDLRYIDVRRLCPRRRLQQRLPASEPRRTTIRSVDARNLALAPLQVRTRAREPVVESSGDVWPQRIGPAVFPGAEGRRHTLKVHVPELAEPATPFRSEIRAAHARGGCDVQGDGCRVSDQRRLSCLSQECRDRSEGSAAPVDDCRNLGRPLLHLLGRNAETGEVGELLNVRRGRHVLRRRTDTLWSSEKGACPAVLTSCTAPGCVTWENNI